MPTAANTSIFDSLPGLPTPVDRVHATLAEMWDSDGPPGDRAHSEYRASQMNLILHLGLNSTPESARMGFDTAMKFSERYPCRTIALCPLPADVRGEVSAKLYSECYIGSSAQDMVCSEAVILAYPSDQRSYLEDQTSIMLESDLPLYYWARNIRSVDALVEYRRFLGQASRVIIDSAIESDAVRDFPWPGPGPTSDLAYARILPVRQSVGHFLSYLPPDRIVEGLKSVNVSHDERYRAEARTVFGWLRKGLDGCAEVAGIGDFGIEEAVKAGSQAGESLAIDFAYSGKGGLAFRFNFDDGVARLESSLRGAANTVTTRVRLLSPEKALAEALFF